MNTKVKKQKRVDVIIGSKRIKNSIMARKNEFKLTYTKMVQDAKEAGITGLTKSTLSLYFNNDKAIAGFPTQRHIIFLCMRYGIGIGLDIKTPKITQEDIDGKFKEIGKRFSDETEQRLG